MDENPGTGSDCSDHDRERREHQDRNPDGTVTISVKDYREGAKKIRLTLTGRFDPISGRNSWQLIELTLSAW